MSAWYFSVINVGVYLSGLGCGMYYGFQWGRRKR